jgi:hypothetical protein
MLQVSADTSQTPTAAAAAATAAAHGRMYSRWQLLSRKALAGGVLEVVSWEGERCLRIWLPPGEKSQQQQQPQGQLERSC